MQEKIEQMIREYKEIKEVNEFTIDKLNNENIIIENFIRDLKLLNKKELNINKINEFQLNIFNCLDEVEDV